MKFLPLHMLDLTEEMKVKAERELGETKAVRIEKIAEFRKLLQAEKNIIWREDDNNLQIYLRARKFDIKRSYKLFLNLYNVKRATRDSHVYDLEGLRNSIRKQTFSLLPYRDEDGCAILIIDLGNWDYRERSIASLMHDIGFLVFFCIEYPATQVCGMKVIFDLEKLSLGHVTALHPRYLNLLAKGAMDSMPVRLKEVHILSDSLLLSYFWNIMKRLISTKIRNRVHFHSAKDCRVTSFISPEIIPVRYGGNHHLDNEKLLKSMEHYDSMYLKNLNCGFREIDQ